MNTPLTIATRNVPGLLFAGGLLAAAPGPRGDPTPVSVKLSEWKVQLSQATVPTGKITLIITNVGSIPHALEIEGAGIERKTGLIQPGQLDTLTLDLKPGRYEIYCPVGENSHKKLGMETHLNVGRATGVSGASGDGRGPGSNGGTMREHEGMVAPVKGIRVTGGGPVIQILPGPFPFPDSAGPILKSFGEEHEALESQSQHGPYSNNVVRITGTFLFDAWDKGAVKDSVHGLAEFITADGAQWKLVLDRVQTRDVPHHPKFGGVIFGLYYHGATGVHTPLVPTINSAVASWTIGHLYKNGALVTDNAYTHVMLLSRTRRDKDFALECWDCSRNKIEELQLQVTPAPGEPKFDAPGGFLFVNWERASSRSRAN